MNILLLVHKLFLGHFDLCLLTLLEHLVLVSKLDELLVTGEFSKAYKQPFHLPLISRIKILPCFRKSFVKRSLFFKRFNDRVSLDVFCVILFNRDFYQIQIIFDEQLSYQL